jgi:hypothetical protein
MADRGASRSRRSRIVALALAVLAVAPAATATAQPVDVVHRLAIGSISLDWGAPAGTRWHLRELRTIAAGDRSDDGAPAFVELESWFYGCTSRTRIAASAVPAMVGWEFGGMLSPVGFVGYLYDPVARVIYLGDRMVVGTVHGAWDTCGLGLRGYVLHVPGGQPYLVRHGVPLADAPDPALVDPRLAHPGARVREVLPGTMNAIYRRALHIRPRRLGP